MHVIFASAVSVSVLSGCLTGLGEARARGVMLPPGDPIVPCRDEGARTEGVSGSASGVVADLLESWASMPLPDWKEKGKVDAPRIMLAKLTLYRDVDEVNRYLMSLQPWGRVGSTWPLHREGDYDFTEIPLCALLFLFGGTPELLYRQTSAHVAGMLLTQEGGSPKLAVPRTLGTVKDTENHILMTEGSRYLKNQWLRLNGSQDPAYDNESNGLEQWLYRHLVELEQAGFYEFNSNPYLGYTTMALLTLEAFAASERIRSRARLLLDTAALHYAYGSLGFRRYPPFRRQLARAGRTGLDTDPHTALMKTWMCLARPERTDITIDQNTHQAVYAALMPYRLPERIIDLLEGRRTDYYVRIGRGPGASPEIYSGGPGYLLSAGGCGRGRSAGIVARPIVLFLEDAASDVRDTFHIPGRGRLTRWNNTGVLPLFSVGEQPVSVPAGATASAESFYESESAGGWRIYKAPGKRKLLIAVHCAPELGIIALFPDWPGSSQTLADALLESNPDPDKLYAAFSRPGGGSPFSTVSYDLEAGPGTWAVEAVDGRSVDRSYDRWPRLRAGPCARINI